MSSHLEAKPLVSAALPEKQVDPYYLTSAHKAWAQQVMKRDGGRCRRCGSTARYADHIVEIKDRGARLDPANGQALCAKCHTTKTAAMKAMRRKSGGRGV